MAMSFRTIRNLGLGILSVIIIILSLFSYGVMKENTDRLSAIVNIEQIKLKNWHDLSELLRDSKDRLYDYHFKKTEIIAPVLLLVAKAVKKLEEIRKITKHKEESVIIDDVARQIEVYKQAVFAYQEEAKEGYPGGSSAKKMEEITLNTADSIVELSSSAVNDIMRNTEKDNKIVLKITHLSQKILGLVLIITVIITFFAAFFMARALSRPIRQLLKGTQKIAQGDLDYRVNVKSHDEIGQLADSFNKMAGDLEKFMNKEKEFLKIEAEIIAEKKKAEEFALLNQQLKKNEQTLLKIQEELKKKVAALELHKEVTIGRELEMIKLKKEVNELLNQSGEKSKYDLEKLE